MRNGVPHTYGLRFSPTVPEQIHNINVRPRKILAGIGIFVLAVAICIFKVHNLISFWYAPLLEAYSLLAAAFVLSRAALSMLYREPQDHGYLPTLSIVIAAKNEGVHIADTIHHCFRSRYPLDRMEVIAIDDGSTDDTWQHMTALEAQYPRLKNFRFEKNKGKRHGMAYGAEKASGEILVYVDSDSYVEPEAVYRIVQPFVDRRIGAVSGHILAIEEENNFISKMEAARYYVSHRIMKAAESVFGAVTCCPGAFSAYRRSCVLRVLPTWLNQRFLGTAATFGDDRSLTNYILRTHQVIYHAGARCVTYVPDAWRKFFKQQLRWKKSWARETTVAARLMYQKASGGRAVLLRQYSFNDPFPAHGPSGAGLSSADGYGQLPALLGWAFPYVHLSLSFLLLSHPIQKLVLRSGLCRSVSRFSLLPELLRDVDRSTKPLGNPMIEKETAIAEDYSQTYYSQWIIIFLLTAAFVAFYWYQTHVYRSRPGRPSTANTPTGNWFYVLRMPEMQVQADRRSSRQQFSKWMDAMQQEGFHFFLLSDVLRRLNQGMALPEKSAVIVFDPGYRRTADTFMPVLKEKHIPGVWLTNGLAIEASDKRFVSRHLAQVMKASGQWDLGYYKPVAGLTLETGDQRMLLLGHHSPWKPDAGRFALNRGIPVDALDRLNVNVKWTEEDLVHRLLVERPVQGPTILSLQQIQGRDWGIGLDMRATRDIRFTLRAPADKRSGSLYWLGTVGLNDVHLRMEVKSLVGEMRILLRSDPDAGEDVSIVFGRGKVSVDQDG